MAAVSPIAELNESIQTSPSTEIFASLLSATQDRKAAVAHDKIFGVAGIPTGYNFL